MDGMGKAMADFLFILTPLTRSGEVSAQPTPTNPRSCRLWLPTAVEGQIWTCGQAIVVIAVFRWAIKTQQTAAVVQQPLHIFQAGELIRLTIGGAVVQPRELQLHRLQALFQLHEPLGEGVGGLGQILGVAGIGGGCWPCAPAFPPPLSPVPCWQLVR
jgi:hypothetical protein